MAEIELPEIIEFDSGVEGPHFVCTGAIHGNEPCGPKAIRRVMKDIEEGRINIKRGKVTFSPVSNPRAFKQNVRFTDRNLNRMMFPKDNPQAYEDYLDNVLCPIFAKANILLDLHSCFSKSPPFICLGPRDKAHAEFARILGVSHYMHGIADSLKEGNSADDERYAMGTTEYTRSQGGIGLTLECGSHLDESAPDVGYQAILRTLKHYDLADIEEGLITPLENHKEICIGLTKAFYKEKPGKFVKLLDNFMAVRQGEILAIYDDGEAVKAPADGTIIMPRDHDEIGTEWFYFGQPSDYFKSIK